MPIQMAAASSHAPSLFFDTYEGWQRMHHRLNDGHPQPPETELETEEVIAQRVGRIQSNFARLKAEYTRFKPDAIITVVGDQREWFDASNIPNVLIYAGGDAWTTHNTGLFDEVPQPDPEDARYRYEVNIDTELANLILTDLVDDGFDVAFAREMQPQHLPGRGLPHGIGHVMPHTHPSLSIPIVPIFVNVDDGPPVIMNGERCVQLGRAIAKVCARSEKRILITGSGGMSHDPRGVRSGWVDELQDQWFLEQLTGGNVPALSSMFSFRSELFRSGGGELRTWIVAAAAMDYMHAGHKAAWVDYIPARKVTTGAGWMYFNPISDEAARLASV